MPICCWLKPFFQVDLQFFAGEHYNIDIIPFNYIHLQLKINPSTHLWPVNLPIQIVGITWQTFPPKILGPYVRAKFLRSPPNNLMLGGQTYGPGSPLHRRWVSDGARWWESPGCLWKPGKIHRTEILIVHFILWLHMCI